MIEHVFVNIPCKVSAYEAEEVGVEHLLREIKNLDINSLENKIKDKVASLTTLQSKIKIMEDYLQDIYDGKVTADQNLVFQIQNILMKLGQSTDQEFLKQLGKQINEGYQQLYVGSVMNTVMKLHDLIDNKLENIEKDKLQGQQAVESKAQ